MNRFELLMEKSHIVLAAVVACGLFLCVSAVLRAAPAAGKPASCDSLKRPVAFGIRLRKTEVDKEEIYEPVVIAPAPTNEATMVSRSSGELCIFFINRPGNADKMMHIRSTDGGISWSEPEKAFDLPGNAYYANQVLEDTDGVLHAIFHLFAVGDNGYRGRHLDVWHTRKRPGKTWEKPGKIYTGYVGSMRGFVQLTNGRLLLSFARAVPAREKKPSPGRADYGWNEVVILYSDDNGRKWAMADDILNIQVDPENVTRYGAIEPTIVELTAGRVWMLIRTNKGHLYESFSADYGLTWSQPQPTDWISSDSPATLLRLRDNRLVMMWSANQRYDDPRSYANGGREVLHAAISGDEGKTWSGYREVLTSPADSPEKGDRGSAYPSAAENSDGKVVFVSGQAEGRAIGMFDPDWLEEKRVYDDFSDGLLQWTLYGSEAAFGLDSPAFTGKRAFRVRKVHGSADGEAVWNFPMAKKGKITIRVRGAADAAMEFGLTDHFSVSHDTMAITNAVLRLRLEDTVKENGPMRVVEIVWDTGSGTASVHINGKHDRTLPFSRDAATGLNYLRAGQYGAAADRGYYITSVDFEAL